MRPPRFRALTDADLGKLLRRASFAEQFVERALRRAFIGTTRDLDAIEELISSGFVTQSDAYATQCLAVSLGIVLASQFDELSWVVAGEAGREAFILQHLESGLSVSPLELLHLRLRGESRVEDLFTEAVRTLQVGSSNVELLH